MVEIKNIFAVKLGSTWGVTYDKKFLVTNLIENDQGIWVYYEDIKNRDKKYHCLIDSFTHRFSECIS